MSNLFIKCDCCSHSLEIECDPKYKEMSFSVWSIGRYGEILSWCERARWIWRILRTGSPWGDSVMFSEKKKIQEVIDFLEKNKENLT